MDHHRRQLDAAGSGWLCDVQRCSSPNFDARPDHCDIVLIVIHSISLPPGCFGGDAIERLFCNDLDFDEHPYYQTIRGLKVSAHFLVRRDGKILQFVSCDERAWHAGVSSWQHRQACNDFSIGIELEGSDDSAFEPQQYESLNRLIESLCDAYPAIEHIAGHNDIAPQRKTDPGPHFSWDKVSSRVSRT